MNPQWGGNRGRGRGTRGRPRGGWRGAPRGAMPRGTPPRGGRPFGGMPRGGRGNRGMDYMGGQLMQGHQRGYHNSCMGPPENFNQPFPTHPNDLPWGRNRGRHLFPQSNSMGNFQPATISQGRPFLSPPRINNSPARPPSPLPGSEEYMQRDISEKSAFLKRQLKLEGPHCNDYNFNSSLMNFEPNVQDYSNDVGIDEIGVKQFVVNSGPCDQIQNKNSKRFPRKQKQSTTLSVEEIHDKIINHISNLSYSKKMNLVNQAGPSEYDVAVQQVTRQMRLELSKALRDMCNNKFKETENTSELINAIIPDFDIKIEDLPQEVVRQLSTTLDENVEERIQTMCIDPELMFQQAANMLNIINNDQGDCNLSECQNLLNSGLDYSNFPSIKDCVGMETDGNFSQMIQEQNCSSDQLFQEISSGTTMNFQNLICDSPNIDFSVPPPMNYSIPPPFTVPPPIIEQTPSFSMGYTDNVIDNFNMTIHNKSDDGADIYNGCGTQYYSPSHISSDENSYQATPVFNDLMMGQTVINDVNMEPMSENVVSDILMPNCDNPTFNLMGDNEQYFDIVAEVEDDLLIPSNEPGFHYIEVQDPICDTITSSNAEESILGDSQIIEVPTTIKKEAKAIILSDIRIAPPLSQQAFTSKESDVLTEAAELEACLAQTDIECNFLDFNKSKKISFTFNKTTPFIKSTVLGDESNAVFNDDIKKSKSFTAAQDFPDVSLTNKPTTESDSKEQTTKTECETDNSPQTLVKTESARNEQKPSVNCELYEKENTVKLIDTDSKLSTHIQKAIFELTKSEITVPKVKSNKLEVATTKSKQAKGDTKEKEQEKATKVKKIKLETADVINVEKKTTNINIFDSESMEGKAEVKCTNVNTSSDNAQNKPGLQEQKESKENIMPAEMKRIKPIPETKLKNPKNTPVVVEVAKESKKIPHDSVKKEETKNIPTDSVLNENATKSKESPAALKKTEILTPTTSRSTSLEIDKSKTTPEKLQTKAVMKKVKTNELAKLVMKTFENEEEEDPNAKKKQYKVKPKFDQEEYPNYRTKLDRSRYDKFYSQKYEEDYKKKYKDKDPNDDRDDRHRRSDSDRSFEKQKEKFRSSDSEHSESHRFIKYQTEREDLRHTKRYYHDPYNYNRSEYVDYKNDYYPTQKYSYGMEYYPRQEEPFYQMEEHEPKSSYHAHKYKNRYEKKSHKKHSKKHKKQREKSASSISSFTSSDRDSSGSSAVKKTKRKREDYPDSTEEKSKNKSHKKPLKERIQMLYESKIEKKREGSYSDYDESRKIKSEPVSPEVSRQPSPERSKSVENYSQNDSKDLREALNQKAITKSTNATEDLEELPISSTKINHPATPVVPFTNKPCPSRQQVEDPLREREEMIMNRDKISFRNKPYALTNKSNSIESVASINKDEKLETAKELPDIDNIAKIISNLSTIVKTKEDVKKTDDNQQTNDVQMKEVNTKTQTVKEQQRSWKSPGEKKFMMEHLRRNPPYEEEELDYEPNDLEQKRNPDFSGEPSLIGDFLEVQQEFVIVDEISQEEKLAYLNPEPETEEQTISKEMKTDLKSINNPIDNFGIISSKKDTSLVLGINSVFVTQTSSKQNKYFEDYETSVGLNMQNDKQITETVVLKLPEKRKIESEPIISTTEKPAKAKRKKNKLNESKAKELIPLKCSEINSLHKTLKTKSVEPSTSNDAQKSNEIDPRLSDSKSLKQDELTKINLSKTDPKLNPQQIEILHSAEVSSTSDASLKSKIHAKSTSNSRSKSSVRNLVPVKETPPTVLTEIVKVSQDITTVKPSNLMGTIPPMDNSCTKGNMLVTTYTQTNTDNQKSSHNRTKKDSKDKKDSKSSRRNKSRSKSRSISISTQTILANANIHTQTPNVRYKSVQVQMEDEKSSKPKKSMYVQTESVVMVDSLVDDVEEVQVRDKSKRKILKAVRRRKTIEQMFDLDKQIERLTKLRQSLYKKLNLACDDSSEEDDELKTHSRQTSSKKLNEDIPFFKHIIETEGVKENTENNQTNLKTRSSNISSEAKLNEGITSSENTNMCEDSKGSNQTKTKNHLSQTSNKHKLNEYVTKGNTESNQTNSKTCLFEISNKTVLNESMPDESKGNAKNSQPKTKTRSIPIDNKTKLNENIASDSTKGNTENNEANAKNHFVLTSNKTKLDENVTASSEYANVLNDTKVNTESNEINLKGPLSEISNKTKLTEALADDCIEITEINHTKAQISNTTKLNNEIISSVEANVVKDPKERTDRKETNLKTRLIQVTNKSKEEIPSTEYTHKTEESKNNTENNQRTSKEMDICGKNTQLELNKSIIKTYKRLRKPENIQTICPSNSQDTVTAKENEARNDLIDKNEIVPHKHQETTEIVGAKLIDNKDKYDTMVNFKPVPITDKTATILISENKMENINLNPMEPTELVIEKPQFTNLELHTDNTFKKVENISLNTNVCANSKIVDETRNFAQISNESAINMFEHSIEMQFIDIVEDNKSKDLERKVSSTPNFESLTEIEEMGRSTRSKQRKQSRSPREEIPRPKSVMRKRQRKKMEESEESITPPKESVTIEHQYKNIIKKRHQRKIDSNESIDNNKNQSDVIKQIKPFKDAKNLFKVKLKPTSLDLKLKSEEKIVNRLKRHKKNSDHKPGISDELTKTIERVARGEIGLLDPHKATDAEQTTPVKLNKRERTKENSKMKSKSASQLAEYAQDIDEQSQHSFADCLNIMEKSDTDVKEDSPSSDSLNFRGFKNNSESDKEYSPRAASVNISEQSEPASTVIENLQKQKKRKITDAIELDPSLDSQNLLQIQMIKKHKMLGDSQLDVDNGLSKKKKRYPFSGVKASYRAKKRKSSSSDFNNKRKFSTDFTDIKTCNVLSSMVHVTRYSLAQLEEMRENISRKNIGESNQEECHGEIEESTYPNLKIVSCESLTFDDPKPFYVFQQTPIEILNEIQVKEEMSSVECMNKTEAREAVNSILHLETSNEAFEDFVKESMHEYKGDDAPPILSPMNEEVESKMSILDDLEIVDADDNYSMNFEGFAGAILVVRVIMSTAIAASDKGQIFCFNMHNGELINSFEMSKSAMTSMIIIRRGNTNLVYTGSLDSTLGVLNFDTKEILKHEKMPEPVQCMEFAWNYIFIGSDRGSLIRYDLNFEKVEDLIKISDSNVLVIKATQEGPRKVLVIATRNAPVSIRDASSGLLLRTMETPFSPTVYTLLFEKNLIYCGTSQHDILVYTFEDGQLIFKHEATKSKGVVCMQIVGNLLFAGCYNGNIYVYNTKSNIHLGTMNGPGGLMLSMEIVHNKIIVGTKSSNFRAWRIPQKYLDQM